MPAAAACVGTILLGWAVTRPEELRPFRWCRILLSLPIVVLIASVFVELDQVRGYMAMWGIGVLGFLWAGPLAHAGSGGFHRLIYGGGNGPSAAGANFSEAKALGNQRNFAEAVQSTLAELEKEPSHYEGLLLLSELYQHTGEHKKALGAIDRLLENGRLTPEQRQAAEYLQKRLSEAILVAELNSR